MPESTSPVPPLASPGLPLLLIAHPPSAKASTLPAPLSTTAARNFVCQRERGGEPIVLHRGRRGREQPRGLRRMRRDGGRLRARGDLARELRIGWRSG